MLTEINMALMDDEATDREAAAALDWMLVGQLPNQTSPSRVVLNRFPFVVGRIVECDLQLTSPSVSKRHAEIFSTTGAVIVRDLGSTNGTFVNGQHILQPTVVGDGDLLQFADVELCLTRRTVVPADHTMRALEPARKWMISRMHEVLYGQRLQTHYQPIVRGPERELVGFEALARTDVEGLESPVAMFTTAGRLGLEVLLSRACRAAAVRTAREYLLPGTLFLNTHPSEVLGEPLLHDLRGLRDAAEGRPIVIEIHEEAASDVRSFRNFRAALEELDMQIAFDDFGAGRARLLELGEIQPHYLKFDRSLVKDLGTPHALHTGLVRSLHEHARHFGIETLAEGLETAASIDACDEIGIGYFQGYAFGRPQPPEHWSSSSSTARLMRLPGK